MHMGAKSHRYFAELCPDLRQMETPYLAKRPISLNELSGLTSWGYLFFALGTSHHVAKGSGFKSDSALAGVERE